MCHGCSPKKTKIYIYYYYSLSLLRPFPAAVFSPPPPQAQKYSFWSTKPQLLASSSPFLSASQRMGPSWRRSSPSWPQPMPASGSAPVKPLLARLEPDLCGPSPHSIKPALQVALFVCVCVCFRGWGGAGAWTLVLPQLRVVTLSPSICQHFPAYQVLPLCYPI